MNLTRIDGRIRRAWSICRQQGPGSFVRALMERTRERLGQPSAERIAFLQSKAAADARFDHEYGVDTGGVERLYDLAIEGPNAAFGVNHVAVDPDEFALAMASLDIDLADATFLDLGAGKARAMMLAAAYPFRTITGVEFARELHEAGIENIARAAPRLQAPERLHLHLGDAATFAMPDGPLVIYLYNPFDAPVMAPVAHSATTAWTASPRPMRVLYVNPVHLDVWTGLGWRLISQERAFAILTPPTH